MEPHKILGINKNASKEEATKACKRLVKKHHPDKFKTKAAKEKHKTEFQKIMEAKARMVGKERSLVKRDTSLTKNQITKVVSELMKNQPKKSLESKTTDLLKSEKEKVEFKLRLPKISSNIIFTILAFIYFFPEQIQKIPFYGSNFSYLTESSLFRMIWLVVLIYVGIFWLYIRIIEWSYFNGLRYLMRRENLEEFYEEAKRKLSRKKKFSKSEFIDLIEVPRVIPLSFSFVRVGNKEEVAETILKEFQDRDLIHKLKVKGFEDWYKF